MCVPPPPHTGGGGIHSRLRVRESQLRRLEKKLTALSTLCINYYSTNLFANTTVQKKILAHHIMNLIRKHLPKKETFRQGLAIRRPSRLERPERGTTCKGFD
jgi:hypothetical protein